MASDIKVFISYSRDEAWLAGRMKAELVQLGVHVFTYETNVATGDYIFDKIRENLIECDDFIILLTPTSVTSPWVLVELGGALVLNKRVIAFHTYLKPNEIPDPITPVMRRHINDTKPYYDELVTRVEVSNFVLKRQEKIQEQAPELPAEPLTEELEQSDVQKLANDPFGKADQMTEIVRRLFAARPVPSAPPRRTPPNKRKPRKRE